MSSSHRKQFFFLLRVASLSMPKHICLYFFNSSLICFVCFVLMLLCSQAPISAVITMETVPSCVSPPPRPPEPACAQQDTACEQASSLVRVGHINTHNAFLIQQVFGLEGFLLNVFVYAHKSYNKTFFTAGKTEKENKINQKQKQINHGFKCPLSTIYEQKHFRSLLFQSSVPSPI